jgi:hypothetical protein
VSKQLSRIAPWQAGKLFAVLYFFLSLIFVIPMILIAAIAPMPVGPGFHFSVGTLLFFPFMYALVALIFVPLACWFYNIAAKFVGGLEVTVTEVADV